MLPDSKTRKLINVIFFILFSTTPEKARKRSKLKDPKDKGIIGVPLVCADQQLKVGTHVFFRDGLVMTYAGVIKKLNIEEKTCMITYFAWPTKDHKNWKISISEWEHDFKDIEGILDEPFEKIVTAHRKEYIFAELLHLTDEHHEHERL